MRLRQVFLEYKFDAIGHGLQQAEWPDARGSPAILDVRGNLALEPDAVSHRRQ